MNVIYKYELALEDIQSLQLPNEAEILTVQVQEGLGSKETICMWVRLDPSAPKTYRYFAVIGTGREFEFQGNYIATIQSKWTFAWHVFEVIK